ncbi:hypothetical protein [Mesorhizobium captivum]|uniref:hypothetical protein n=1 Tax=Mesorhizobium captivum TaxID=3072319 RepID=UPI002A23D3D5|nr:hypothetical protein [Mesorhizobium sp. VK3C]MDX8449110.1 hypothetical protein [Mesorhizobium sp. VK3C]
MGSIVSTTFRYWSGFSARTAAMTPAPWARKSARSAAAKSSPSVFFERFGRPATAPAGSGLRFDLAALLPVGLRRAFFEAT